MWQLSSNARAASCSFQRPKLSQRDSAKVELDERDDGREVELLRSANCLLSFVGPSCFPALDKKRNETVAAAAAAQQLRSAYNLCTLYFNSARFQCVEWSLICLMATVSLQQCLKDTHWFEKTDKFWVSLKFSVPKQSHEKSALIFVPVNLDQWPPSASASASARGRNEIVSVRWMLCWVLLVAGKASKMVDLGGYVIILVETQDKRVKLYGKIASFGPNVWRKYYVAF